MLGLALLAAFDPPAQAAVAGSSAQWLEVPFAQRLDIGTVRALVATGPAQLLQAIAALGVNVLAVKTPAAQRPPNPLLAAVPPAPEELVRRAEFRDSYEGRLVLRSDPACALERDTILIRDTATGYTLLHELTHSRLEPIDECPDDGDIELRFAVDLRRLVLYQRRVYDDAFRLLDPRWRHDILGAQGAVAERLFRRIQVGQSQEAIVEKVLAGIIDEGSPYHDAARRAQGLRYGERMIDNAIDLFNLVESGVAFVGETVRHLHAEVRAGRIPEAPELRLSDDDAREVEQAVAALQPTLARVRGEIVALKRFFTR
jgi:hypothetical protein